MNEFQFFFPNCVNQLACALLFHQKTQFKRGGLSVCLKDEDVAKEFRNLHALNEKKIFPKNTCSEEKAFPKTKKIKKMKIKNKKNS